MTVIGKIPVKDDRPLRDLRALVACTVLGTTGFSSYLGLPFLLGAITDARGFDERQIGWIGSAELFGMLLGSLLTAPLIGRARGRHIALVAILTAIVGQMTTGLVHGLGAMLFLRLVTGAAGGACYALALARLATFNDPTRSFSLFGLGLTGFSAIEVVLLPWLAGKGGLIAMFLCLAVGHAVAAFALPWLPEGRAVEIDRASQPSFSPGLRRAGQASLFATFFFSIAATSFWAYVERQGAATGLSGQFVGWIFNIATLIGMVTCLLTFQIERRAGQLLPQLLSLVATGALLATWPPDAGPLQFGIRSLLYYQLLVVSQILQQTVLATTDPSGRQAALMPAAQGAGFALGPIVGGALLSAGLGYSVKLAVEGAAMVVTALLYAVVYRMIAHARVDAPPPHSTIVLSGSTATSHHAAPAD